MTRSAPSLNMSVVVPAYNMADTIGACLRALASQAYPRSLTEIIVVDNGSSDGTRAAAAAFPVTCLHEQRRGAPSARNRGIEAASGAVVAFTDADCVPTSGWVAGLARGFDDPAVNIVAGPVRVLDPEASIVARYSSRVGQYDPARSLSHPRFPYAGTANVAVRRSLFDRVGLFDPWQLTHDALEFFWRVRRAGLLTFAVEPRALVFYRTRASLAAMAAQHFAYGRGYSRFLLSAHEAGDGPRPTFGRVASSCSRRLRRGLAELVANRGSGGCAWCAAVHIVRETATACGRGMELLGGGRRPRPQS